MDKTLKVVLLNKTTLPNGVTGPEYTPMTIAVLEMIQSIKSITPTPKFAYASNIIKAITLDELEKMITPFETADHAAAIKVLEEEKKDEVILDKVPEAEVIITEPVNTELEVPILTPEPENTEEGILIEGTLEKTEGEVGAGEVIVATEGTQQVMKNKKRNY